MDDFVKKSAGDICFNVTMQVLMFNTCLIIAGSFSELFGQSLEQIHGVWPLTFRSGKFKYQCDNHIGLQTWW